MKQDKQHLIKEQIEVSERLLRSIRQFVAKLAEAITPVAKVLAEQMAKHRDEIEQFMDAEGYHWDQEQGEWVKSGNRKEE